MFCVLISVEKTGSLGALGPLKLLFLFEFEVEVFDVDEVDEFDDEGRTEFRTLRLNTAFFRPPDFFFLHY